MIRPANRYHLLILLLLTFSSGWVCLQPAHAHRPHDNITDVAISTGYDKDGTAFVIVMNETLKVTRNHGNTWSTLNKGLDNVHPFTALSISPAFDEDGTIFVSSGGDGVYRSFDFGRSWEKSLRGFDDLDIRIVEISPVFEKTGTVLAADARGNLYRTDDLGRTWAMIFSTENEITSIDFLPTSAAEQILVGDRKGTLHRFDGKQWEAVIVKPEWGSISSLAVSPDYASDRTFWIGTENHGIFKTSDGGQSWVPSNDGISQKRITSLLALPEAGKVQYLYATTWNEALFRSEDQGATWKKFPQGLSTDRQADAPDFLLPHFKGIAANRSQVLLGGFDGLFLSKDAGETWRQLETWPIGHISMLALSPATDRGRQAAVLAYGGGAYRIPDVKATNWVDEAQSLTLAGIPGKRTDSGISDVSFSPAYWTDHTLFAATEHELIKSDSDGKHWSRVTIEKPFTFRLRSKLDHYLRKAGVSSANRLKIVGFFPLIPGWSTYIAISPNFREDGSVFFSTQGLGQCLSTDWGKSCAIVFDTALQVTTSMAISPNYPEDGTLFLAIQGAGVYKTSDFGAEFERSGRSLPIDGQIKLAVSPEYPEDQTILAGTGSGLFISENGGNSWVPSGRQDLPENGTILSVAVSPNYEEDRTVLVAVKGRGLYKSTDAARSFFEAGTDLIDQNEQLKQVVFTQAYAQDHSIYGVSTENVFYSRDGGATWSGIQRPVRYEDVRDVIEYRGDWQSVSGGEYSDSTQTRSNLAGNTATLRFNGSGIRLIGQRSPENGTANIYLDGEKVADVNLRSAEYRPSEMVFERYDLKNDAHEIRVEVADSGNTAAGWVAVDAFEVLP